MPNLFQDPMTESFYISYWNKIMNWERNMNWEMSWIVDDLAWNVPGRELANTIIDDDPIHEWVYLSHL